MNSNCLTFVQTGAIQYPRIHQRILDLTTPALVLRPLLVELPVLEGNTMTFVKQKGVAAKGISLGSEGGPALRDYTSLDYATVTVFKRKQGFEISDETVDDTGLPILENQMQRMTSRWAMQFEADILNCLAAAVPETATFAATGKTNGVNGEITIANTIGVKDINKAARLLKSKNQLMTDIVCGIIAEEGLRNLPMFTEYSPPQQPQLSEAGIIGKIGRYNLRVSSLIPDGTAYAVSNGMSPNGEYNPLGFLAVKKPVTTKTTRDEENEKLKMSMSARYAPIITNGNCLVSITGLATS